MRNWWQIKQAARVVAQNLLAGKGAADQILELPLLFMIHVTSQKSLRAKISLRSIVRFLPQSFLHDATRDSYLFTWRVGITGFYLFFVM